MFDEPTAGLDARGARTLARLLRQTHDAASGELGRRRTTIVLTHDLPAFEGLADGFLVLDRATKQLTFGLANTPAPSTGNGSASAEGGRRRSTDPGVLGVQRLLLESAAFARTLGEAAARLPPVFPGIVLRSTVRFVLEPLLFVVVVSAVIGGLATFFALRNNPLEGAFVNQVMTGVGKVLIAVLVPLLAGLFFTARMAAGGAARIGTMQRTGQVAGLRLLGIRAADYLLTPLVWAMSIALPIVTAAGVIAAALSSLLAHQLVLGLARASWAVSFFATVDRADIAFVSTKAALSGALVAILTYHVAIGPKRSGAEVGAAVNACIVLGMTAVLVVHAVLTIVQFR